MVESMTDRVARAICTSQTQTDKMWQAFLPEATAAIEAMREELSRWAHEHYDEGGGVVESAIDAALNEQVSG